MMPIVYLSMADVLQYLYVIINLFVDAFFYYFSIFMISIFAYHANSIPMFSI